MYRFLSSCLLLSLFYVSSCDKPAPKVLFFIHPFVTSHIRLHYVIAKPLIAKGYNVSILRWGASAASAVYPTPKGAHVIDYDDSKHEWVQETINNMVWKTHDVYMDYIKFMAKGTQLAMRPCLVMQQKTELMQRLKNENYSLAVVDPQAYPCGWVIANRLEVPYVTVAASAAIYFITRGSLTPVPMSYVPSLAADRTDRMNLIEKSINIVDHFFLTCGSYWYLINYSFKALSYLTNPDPWTNMEHSPLLTMMLTHTWIEFPRPLSLTHINMGLLDRVRNPVADELTLLADKGKGTVILSLTTLGGNKDMMPDFMTKSFEDAFARFPDYNFIWRTAQKPLPKSNQSNIFYTNWFNQTNLLAHPKLKLFITHGGIATVLEAGRHGVPMLGMPMAFDHHADIARVVNKGLGLGVLKRDINTENIAQKIGAIFESDSFSSRAQLLKRMLDQEQEIFENPYLWYAEYAIRHGNNLKKIWAKGELLWTPFYFCLDCAVVATFAVVIYAQV